MRWFKHYTESLDDLFIANLIDEFGGDGYLVFFGTVTLMAKEFDVKVPGFCRISETILRQKFRVSSKKLSKILHFCSINKKIYVKKVLKTTNNNKFEYELNCPKLKEIADEWTRKQLQKTPE